MEDIVLKKLLERENDLWRFWDGHVPEANSEFNDLQREKIKAMHTKCGMIYLGKINHYDQKPKTADDVFKQYACELVYNFGADFVVPSKDQRLAELIIKWNDHAESITVLEDIQARIEELGGISLMWT